MSAEVDPSAPDSSFSGSQLIGVALGGIALSLLLAIFGQVQVNQVRQQLQHTLERLNSIQRSQASLLDLGKHMAQYRLEPSAAELRTINANLQMLRADLRSVRTLAKVGDENVARLEQLYQTLPQSVPPNWTAIAQQSSSLKSIIDDQGWFNATAHQLTLNNLYTEYQATLTRQRQSIDWLQSVSVFVVSFGSVLLALLAWAIGREGQRQQRLKGQMAQQMALLNRQQQLNSYLLTCRSLGEASEILQSFFAELLADSSGVIYSISNSRDRMIATASFGTCAPPAEASTNECWALRRGEPRYAEQDTMHIPCPLCDKLHPQGVPQSMICIPMAAHENTMGVLHFSDVPSVVRQQLHLVAGQLAMPLAVLKLQEELQYLSFHDPLTGLYNRRLLEEMLGRSLRTAQRHSNPDQPILGQVGVLFLDVDHFKRFNSQYGHDNGDVVLKALAEVLINNTRTGEDFICRYGGEEFVIVMPSVLQETAIARAERIRQSVRKISGPFESRITISVGVALYPTHGSSVDELLKAANMAMFKAKFNGRDRVVTAAELEDAINDDLPGDEPDL